tara:strand:+ start:106 stop:501 length:396 start_codon:yes stop_codon:yes gene_type:complete
MAELNADEKNLLRTLGSGKAPSWLLKAFDPNSPLHPKEGAAHTESYELEDGRTILVPRVRIRNGEAVVLSKEREALDESLRKKDFIVVPKGMNPTAYSKTLSRLIGKLRGIKKDTLTKPKIRPKTLLRKND